MNKKVAYISEPNEIYLNGEAKMLKSAGYKIINGDKNISNNYTSEIQTLIIRSYTKIDKAILKKLPNLQNLVRVGVGMDHIDVESCKERGINFFNSAGANSNAVAEYVVCQTLAALRKTYLLNESDLVEWNRFKFMGSEMANQTVGLVGFGNIAKLVYKKLNAFDCKKFLVYDPYVDPKTYSFDNLEFCSLDKLFKNSDIISLHLPLNSETHHLINARNLQKFKKGVILINSSRGAIVNEKDIVKFLKDDYLTYIADVFETEPRIKRSLLKQKNFIGSPHIASMTEEANKNMVKVAIKNLVEGNIARI
jgi:phosphoglycerate dehydrogenase-like enzyme